jgi:hypothetical protein
MTTTLIAVSLALAATGQADVKLRTLDGDIIAGNLANLSPQEVAVSTSSGRQSVRADRIHSLAIRENASKARWKVQVELTDGSIVNGASYASHGAKATIVRAGGAKHEVPLKSVVSARLRDQSGELARQWAEYAAEKVSSDRIVIRRKVDPAAPIPKESLDVMDGVIGDVSESAVNFDVGGGDVIPVKRDRIDGLLYFRGRERASAGPSCVVVDIDDSRWAASEFELVDQMLKLKTISGVSLDLPLDQVRKLDFAAGNLCYLAEMPRDAVVRESWSTASDSEMPGLFAPLVGRAPEGRISIGGETKLGQTVWMPAKSAITVRVPEGFARFNARVGFDDRIGSTDGVKLLVEADGKTLLEELIRRESRLVPIDVDLQGAHRVRITVDYGGQSVLGDQLVLCEAMFLR